MPFRTRNIKKKKILKVDNFLKKVSISTKLSKNLTEIFGKSIKILTKILVKTSKNGLEKNIRSLYF